MVRFAARSRTSPWHNSRGWNVRRCARPIWRGASNRPSFRSRAPRERATSSRFKMSSQVDQDPALEALLERKYQHGFVTDIESDTLPPGLDEDVIRVISRKKREPQFLTDWRLNAYRHWRTMTEPDWAHLKIAPIDYQAISYYSAPKAKSDAPKSLAEVDPKLLETYDKLGIPLHERAKLAGVAVDAVFDSVSVATTFKERLT